MGPQIIVQFRYMLIHAKNKLYLVYVTFRFCRSISSHIHKSLIKNNYLHSIHLHFSVFLRTILFRDKSLHINIPSEHAGVPLHVWSALHVVVGDDTENPDAQVYCNVLPIFPALHSYLSC